MPFTIPNVADAFHASQADPDKVDFDCILLGAFGAGVVSGCGLTSNSDMTVAVAAGVIRTAYIWKAVTAGNVTITTADATNPRFDLIVVDHTSGAKSVQAGTPAATPVFPSIPSAAHSVLGAVYVPANDTVIAQNQITEKFFLVPANAPMDFSMTEAGPDNTTAETTLYSFSVPANAMGATGVLRCKIYGQFRPNTNAATFTIRIKFGATTMYADVTPSRAADTDLAAFSIEFILANTATNAQRLGGQVWLGNCIAATSGFGELGTADGAAGNLSNSTPIYGTAAIDTTAAVTLDVTAQLSAAGTSNQCLKQMAILERIA